MTTDLRQAALAAALRALKQIAAMDENATRADDLGRAAAIARAALAAAPSSPCAPAEPAAQSGEPLFGFEAGMSWAGKNVYGNAESIKAVRAAIESYSSLLVEYRAVRADLDRLATPAPASPCASPAAAAVADAPRIPDADTYCERHTLAASDEWKRGWNYARVIQAKFGHTPDPQDVEPAAPPPSPSAAEQADDTLRWRLSTIAAECDDPDTTDALDKLLEELPRGPGDGPVYAAVSAAAEQAGRWVPVARVADVHMSRYTIEWLDRPMPEGTVLFTDIIEWAANAPRRRREAAAAPSASPAEAPAEMPYGFESGLVQLLNEARCLSKETVGNRELASRIIRYMRMHDPQPVAPAGQAAAGAQGEAVAEVTHGHWGQGVRWINVMPIPGGTKLYTHPAPAVERGVAELVIAWANETHPDNIRKLDAQRFVDAARSALSTAGKEQA